MRKTSKITKLNVEGKSVPHRKFKQLASTFPIRYVDTESFIAWAKVQGLKLNWDKVRRMKDGQEVAIFRRKRLVLRNRAIYIRRINMIYGTSKGKDGKPRRARELVISSFPIPQSVNLKPRRSYVRK